MDRKLKGKVLWYNEIRGYGFLSPGEGEDVFVHQSAMSSQASEPLQAGQDVEFNIVTSPKGIQAADVTRLP